MVECAGMMIDDISATVIIGIVSGNLLELEFQCVITIRLAGLDVDALVRIVDFRHDVKQVRIEASLIAKFQIVSEVELRVRIIDVEGIVTTQVTTSGKIILGDQFTLDVVQCPRHLNDLGEENVNTHRDGDGCIIEELININAILVLHVFCPSSVDGLFD